MSNVNSKIVLTEQGLSAIATQPWPQIAIKYFVPIYDDRIDTNIHAYNTSYTSAMPLSSSITSADTKDTVYGEIIYNRSGSYLLTKDGTITSAANALIVGNSVVNVNQDSALSRNTYNASPLSNIISAAAFSAYNVGTNTMYFNSTPVGVSSAFGYSKLSTVQRTDMFDSVSFSPIQTPTSAVGVDVVNGLFKFEMRSDVGTYRFNKIAFFVQALDINGNVDPLYQPTLFGQVAFDRSQVVTTDNTGSQIFSVSIQLAFTQKSSTVINTNNDNWTKTPTSASSRNQPGVFWAGDVAIGGATGINAWQPHARLQITDDTGGPQIRLSHSNPLSGIDFTIQDTSTSAMLTIKPTSYSNGVGIAIGTNAFAFGYSPENPNGLGLAIGNNTLANGSGTIALGNGATSINENTVAIGFGASATSNNSMALGFQSLATGAEGAFALGYDTSATALKSFSIGISNIASYAYSFAFGNSNSAMNVQSLALGSNNFVAGDYSLGSGNGNAVYNSYAYSYGLSNILSGTAGLDFHSFAFGQLNNVSNSNSYAIGSYNILAGAYTFAVGKGNNLLADYAYAFGNGNYVNATNAYAYGLDNSISSDISFTFGYANNIDAFSTSTYSIGHQNSVTSANNSFVIGYNNNLIGNGSDTVYSYGYNNNTNAASACTIGFNNTASHVLSFSFGNSNICNANNSYTVGYQNSASGISSFAIGMDNSTLGGFSYTFGYLNSALTNRNFSVGYKNYTALSDSYAFGSMNVVSGAYSFAAGYSNSITATHSYTFGESNQGCAYGFVVGANNNSIGVGIGNNYTFGFSNNSNYITSAFVVGYSNFATAQSDFIFGYSNSVAAQKSFAVGSANNIDYDPIGNSYSFGCNNEIGYGSIFNSTLYSNNSYIVGESNKTSNPYSYVFGYQNSTSGLKSVIVGEINSINSNNTNTYIFGTLNSVNTNCSGSFIVGYLNSIGTNSPNTYAFGTGITVDNGISQSLNLGFNFQNSIGHNAVIIGNYYSGDSIITGTSAFSGTGNNFRNVYTYAVIGGSNSTSVNYTEIRLVSVDKYSGNTLQVSDATVIYVANMLDVNNASNKRNGFIYLNNGVFTWSDANDTQTLPN